MSWKITQADHSIHSEIRKQCEKAFNSLLNRNDLGFFKTKDREDLFTSSIQRAAELRPVYKTLVVLGMGGSSLGARALLEMNRDLTDRNVVFLDNVDAHRFFKRLEFINGSWGRASEIHWLIVSKSGNTIETLNMANFIQDKLVSLGESLINHSTVVTEFKDNPLFRWAKENKISALELPQDIGGRFSVFTPVGLLPASFAGLDVQKIKDGINEGQSSSDLIVDLSCQMLLSFSRQEWISVLWPYCDDLKDFTYWFSQLWAESLAKTETRGLAKAPRVSTPVGYVGSSDQHSVLQQVAEGEHDKLVVFMRVKHTEQAGPRLQTNLFDGEDILVGHTMGELIAAQAQATQESLSEAGVSTLTLTINKLDEITSSSLMQVWMMVVGTLGEYLDINAFNQPGVEAGKIITKKLLRG